MNSYRKAFGLQHSGQVLHLSEGYPVVPEVARDGSIRVNFARSSGLCLGHGSLCWNAGRCREPW